MRTEIGDATSYNGSFRFHMQAFLLSFSLSSTLPDFGVGVQVATQSEVRLTPTTK
jgi:hypothetical protein